MGVDIAIGNVRDAAGIDLPTAAYVEMNPRHETIWSIRNDTAK